MRPWSLRPRRSTIRRTNHQRTRVHAGTASMQRERLSVFDNFVEQIHFSRLFFYDQAPDPDLLRRSLARALARFPAFSGRLVVDDDGHRVIEHSDRGAVFETVRAAGRMPPYGLEHDAMADFAHFIESPLLSLRSTATRPLLVIRLTVFEQGGAVLGIRNAHAVADGAGVYAFLMAWVAEHVGRPVEGLPPGGRDEIDALGRDVTPAETNPRFEVFSPPAFAAFLALLLWNERRATHATVRFPADQLAAMKAEASASLPEGRWVSTNDVLSAHLWRRLAAPSGCAPDELHTLGLTHSLRSFDPPLLQPGHFGNASIPACLELSTAQLAAASSSELSLAIRDTYQHNAHDVIREDVAFLLEQRRRGRLVRTLSRFMHDLYSRRLMINNWCGLPIYQLDFGHGPPRWAEFPSSPFPLMVITPTPGNADDRDVRISLPTSLMPDYLARLQPATPSA